MTTLCSVSCCVMLFCNKKSSLSCYLFVLYAVIVKKMSAMVNHCSKPINCHAKSLF